MGKCRLWHKYRTIMEMAASFPPPVSKEQAFLETYFQCLSKFAYDKAKDHCEKERDGQKLASGSAWHLLVNWLIQFALAEKTYTSLVYLGQKWFGKRDTLRATYGMLISDLKHIEETTGRHGDSSPQKSVGKILAHLCGQLSHFLTARVKTMDFYEQIATMGSHRVANYGDLLNVVSEITQAHQKNFHHPILSPLKSSFSFECDVITHLLQAQDEMANWRFLPSLLHLNDAHTKLLAYGCLAASKETRKLGFSTSKQPQVPALYQWIAKFKAVLVAKFSLYFYDVLSKQAPPGDMKGLLAKTSIDFYGKITSFQKKSDATNISLVFDTSGHQAIQKGAGYTHPEKVFEPPRGLDTYPTIFSFPGERPERHWPSIISIITDRIGETDAPDKIVYFYDEKLQNTFYLARIEQRITFVVIFESRKSEKDSYITNFILDISTNLKCAKLFASLKPGSK